MTSKASILIVDDNVSLIRTMSFILHRKGYDVVTTEDGQEAIKRVKCRHFDIAFIDIKMPVMSGVEVCKRLKKIEPETVAVMITAYAVEDMIQEALQEGAYGVIYKPIDMEETLKLIDEICEKKQEKTA